MKNKTFVDAVDVIVRSGKGGDGACSFRREALVPFGGPDGGDGGRGGNVVFRASTHVNSLISFAYDPHLFAENGVGGSGNRCFGRRGKDLVVDVPPGTLVTDIATGEVVADLTVIGEPVIIARGGAGGFGNVHFKSSVNQAPTERTLGGAAEEKRLHLELKTIADAGLLGFPNAGKSSLLRAVSAAEPKVASYPFTTLNPMVGVTEYDDFATVTIADVPGIIEGASKGVGLGLAFLKHLERSRVLVYVIDMAGTDNREPWNDYEILAAEIRGYSAEMAERPCIVLANKMDEEAAKENLPKFISETGVTPIPVCCGRPETESSPAVPSMGMDDFKRELRRLVNPPPPGRRRGESAEPPPIEDMPDTTGDEIPETALKFASFLKLDKPKKKSHPSRGNIH